MDCLVLDMSYVPISRISWKKAVHMLVNGRAELLEECEDRQVRCGQFTWNMPSIIRVLRNVACVFRRGVKFNRKNLYFRDHGKCQYCGCKVGMDDFEFEHVIPRHPGDDMAGGQTCWENIVVSCTACNRQKKNRTPAQAGMRLMSVPTKPKSSPGSILTIMKEATDIPQSWRDYLVSIGYWTVTLE